LGQTASNHGRKLIRPAQWQVIFELEEDESLHAAINIRLAGPAPRPV
jgi:hypothetical protein